MKTFFLQFLLTVSLIGLVAIPAYAQAQTPECEALRELIEKNDGGDQQGRAIALPKFCSEAVVYTKVANMLYYIVGIAAVIMIIYAGYVYITAGSNEAKIKKGKNTLLYTIVGIIIALLAVVIVNIVVSLIVDNKFL